MPYDFLRFRKGLRTKKSWYLQQQSLSTVTT